MVPRFSRPIPVLRMVTNQVLDFIYNTHGRRILQWNYELLNARSMQEYAYAVYPEKGQHSTTALALSMDL